jgi:hypothetical protein
MDTATTIESKPANPTESEIEVTLRHPSFGEYAFRATPDDIAGAVAGALETAQQNAATREAIAVTDKNQRGLLDDIAAIDKRIEAAKLLGDEDRVKAETEAKDAAELAASEIVSARVRLHEQLR